MLKGRCCKVSCRLFSSAVIPRTIFSFSNGCRISLNASEGWEMGYSDTVIPSDFNLPSSPASKFDPPWLLSFQLLTSIACQSHIFDVLS